MSQRKLSKNLYVARFVSLNLTDMDSDECVLHLHCTSNKLQLGFLISLELEDNKMASNVSGLAASIRGATGE